MATIFAVTHEVAFGQGGLGNQYWSGKATVSSASPKRAYRKAVELANRAAGEGSCWIPIHERTVIMRNGIMIHDSLNYSKHTDFYRKSLKVRITREK